MKQRRIRVGIITTETDKYGVHYSKPTYSGWFDLDTGEIIREVDMHQNPDSTYTCEMLMPSGTVVPIKEQSKNIYVVKGDNE